jgi:hypothetical protein
MDNRNSWTKMEPKSSATGAEPLELPWLRKHGHDSHGQDNRHGQGNPLVESIAYATPRKASLLAKWLIQTASLVRTIYEGLGDPVLVTHRGTGG